MPYSAYNSSEIAAGEPTKQELFTKAKDNFADHEDRLTTAEAAVNQRPPITFDVIGTLVPPISLTGALHYRVANDMRLLAARVLIPTAGSAGSFECDIQYKRGGGAWTTILTSAISVSYSSGDLAQAAGTLAVTALLAGDLLRLNINSVQTEQTDAHVILENEVS